MENLFEKDKIYNQDCIIGMKRLPDESVDLTVTSPPYDTLRSYNGHITWDFEKFKEVACELYRVTKNGGIVTWIVGDETRRGSESGSSFKQALYFMQCGFLLHDTMIWKKICPFQHRTRYIQSFEYMFVFSKSKPPKTANLICDRKNKWGGTAVHGSERQADGTTRPLSLRQKSKKIKEYGARYNIWDMPGNKNNKTGHPAVFPLQLAVDHIVTWSNEGDIILDPFIGSGTTAIAAIETGRHYIGYEVVPEYYQICINRIAQEDANGKT